MMTSKTYLQNSAISFLGISILLIAALLSSCKNNVHRAAQETVVHDTVRVPSTDDKIKVHSLTQIFYKMCENKVVLNIPDGLSDVSVIASDALVIPSTSDATKYTIVPNANHCTLRVSAKKPDGTITNISETYQVLSPPKPALVLIVNGKDYDGMSAIPKKSTCKIKIMPNADFNSLFPNDAGYQIENIDLLVQRSLGAPTKVGQFSGLNNNALVGVSVGLGNSLQQDVPGTKIYFKISEVNHINFQGNSTPVTYRDSELALGALIK